MRVSFGCGDVDWFFQMRVASARTLDENGDAQSIKSKILHSICSRVNSEGIHDRFVFTSMQGHWYEGYKGPGGRCVALPRHQPLQGVFEGPEDSSSSYAAAGIAHAYHAWWLVCRHVRTHVGTRSPIGHRLNTLARNCFTLRTTARTSVIGKAWSPPRSFSSSFIPFWTEAEAWLRSNCARDA